MSRPLSNSIGQLNRKAQPEASRFHFNCRIQKVNYVSRRLKVAARGYSGPRKVLVQLGIPLGTPDKPIVTTSNIATIEMQNDGTWLCIGIRRKQFCAVGTGGVEDVVVDNDFDQFSSAQTDIFGSLVTPGDIFLPPLETLGQISLPADRFAGGTTPLCNVPPCPDCAPDGYIAGMSPILTEEFCWVWGFKGASCGLYFRSQGAYLDYGASSTATLDQVVAVRENYAYIASIGFNGNYLPAHLFTVDLSDPINPLIIDDQIIEAPVGYTFANLGIAVLSDTLWVSGQLWLIDTPSGDTVINQMDRYDISDRTSPSFVSTWETRLINNYRVFVHYDVMTQTFTGDPYLVGFNWDWADASLCQTELIVEDGLVGGEVQTLSGYTFGRYEPAFVEDLLATNPPVVCDNTVLVRYFTDDGSDPTEQRILSLDLTGIPGSPPTAIWDDDSILQPRVYLGANHAYVTTYDNQERLYSQIDIDGTFTVTSPTFVSDNQSVQNWGYFLKQNCLLRAGNFFNPNGWSMNIVDQENPVLRSQANEPQDGTGGNGSGQDASADQGVTNNRVYLCHVQGGGQFAYLSVYTSP